MAKLLALIALLAMATIVEVERLALDLPESQRAILAARLLKSLPSVLDDHDEGTAEALQRDAALDEETGVMGGRSQRETRDLNRDVPKRDGLRHRASRDG